MQCGIGLWSHREVSLTLLLGLLLATFALFGLSTNTAVLIIRPYYRTSVPESAARLYAGLTKLAAVALVWLYTFTAELNSVRAIPLRSPTLPLPPHIHDPHFLKKISHKILGILQNVLVFCEKIHTTPSWGSDPPNSRGRRGIVRAIV